MPLSLITRVSVYLISYSCLILKYRDVIMRENTLRSLPSLVYAVYYHNFFIASIPIILICWMKTNWRGLFFSLFYIANFDLVNRIVGIKADNKSKKDLKIEEYISLPNILVMSIIAMTVSLIIQETMNEMMFYWDIFGFFYQMVYWSSPVKELFILLGIVTQLFFIKEKVGIQDWGFILIEWFISPIQDFRDLEVDRECNRFTVVMHPQYHQAFPAMYFFTNSLYFLLFPLPQAVVVNLLSSYTIHLLHTKRYGMAYNVHNLRYLITFVTFFY